MSSEFRCQLATEIIERFCLAYNTQRQINATPLSRYNPRTLAPNHFDRRLFASPAPAQ